MPFAVTNEVKVILFQYKVIHNVLPARATLYRDGISESPHIQLMQSRRTNVASPANKLHTNNRFLDSVSRLVVQKNK